MKKAYYIMNVWRIWGSWYKGFYTPPEGESFDPNKALQQRLRSLQQAGVITAAHESYNPLMEGLVGWAGYIILSFGKCAHWKETFYQNNLFGFIFNAQELIEQGALLAIENIIADYDRIIDDVLKRITSTLPPAPEISKKDLDMIMKASRIGDQPFLREWFKQRSRDPLPDVLRAIEKGDINSPECLQVIEEVQQSIQAVNTQKLLKGDGALEYLDSAPEDGNCQLLVWEHLSVDQAIGTVQQGKPCINENCQNLNSLEELEDEKSILYH